MEEQKNNKIWYGDEQGFEEEITSDDWQDLDWLMESSQFERQRQYLRRHGAAGKINGKYKW